MPAEIISIYTPQSRDSLEEHSFFFHANAAVKGPSGTKGVEIGIKRR